MIIPFSPPYNDADVENEVLDSLRSGWITTGPKVKALENEVCKYVGVEAALGVNSATSAMMLVLHWYGITRGDEVIVPAYTYCATALAAMHIGAKVVMVDVAMILILMSIKLKQLLQKKRKPLYLWILQDGHVIMKRSID